MDNLYNKIQPLLRFVNKPTRYIGAEFGSINKKITPDTFNFCMVYPDVYDVGQSNQALRILCNCVNNVEGFFAQRSFLPDPETSEIFKKNNISMFSLETFSPLSQFDAIGITVSHELIATNILETLDFSGIPIKTCDRDINDPFVFGGGPMCANPEPFHMFFDVITIGEGESATINALKKLKSLKQAGLSREEILFELSKMDSIYVPSLYDINKDTNKLEPIKSGVPEKIQRALYNDFSTSDAFENCIVPYVEIVHDRLNIEILRGCARGCRFCQAGIMYRPVRERSATNIINAVKIGLKKTGYNEVSLTSLSTTDHSQIKEILQELNIQLKDKGVRVSIPSQRLDSFGLDMAKLVAGNKRGGLTFAIEAGTQRLRDVINKNVTDEDIFSAVEQAFKNGWNRAKLYFMIGLPTETDTDLVGIANICEEVLKRARQAAGEKRRHGISITASCAIFVPKAQTPFMFDGQISVTEAMRRINLIRNNIRSKAISFSWHSPETSKLEAVLSRGDRNLSNLIYSAWKNGAKFDAWHEHFNYQAWLDAASTLNIDLDDYASWSVDIADKDFDFDRLAWSHIDFGVNNEFFVNERLKANEAFTTPDCTFDKCSNCGVCQKLNKSNDIAGKR